MQQAPEHKIKAIIQAAVSAQPQATTPPKPRQRRPARPAPAAHPQVTTLVIHGGHNVIATHGAVVHWHHVNPSQP